MIFESIMPFPKISAVLNNCPLHILTPEIKEEIAKFALSEAYQNHHNPDYLRLKDIFADFYGFDKLTFNWEQFAGILACYNPYDTQIILGVVLRVFMKELVRTNELTKFLALGAGVSVEDYVQQLTEIEVHSGRYCSLSPDQIAIYVGHPLGLNICYHKDQVNNEINADNAVATIDLYHQGGIDGAQAGGHWERSALAADSIDYLNAETTQLRNYLPLLGNNASISSAGIALVKKHVQLSAKAIGDVLAQEVAELDLTKAQIEKYLFNINFVPIDLAKALLGPNLTSDALQFIESYTYEAIPLDPSVENYIKAPLDAKPPIASPFEMQLISQLLKPVELPAVLGEEKLELNLAQEEAPTQGEVEGEKDNATFLLNAAMVLSGSLGVAASLIITWAIARKTDLNPPANDTVLGLGAALGITSGITLYGLFKAAKNNTVLENNDLSDKTTPLPGKSG